MMRKQMKNDIEGCPEHAPELMTEEEVIRFLRIPEVAATDNHKNVIDNLKRIHGLPTIHISKQPLYPLTAVRRWINEKLLKEQAR